MTAETFDGHVVVVLTLPSNMLRNGDYYLRLSGINPGGDVELIARYYFQTITR